MYAAQRSKTSGWRIASSARAATVKVEVKQTVWSIPEHDTPNVD